MACRASLKGFKPLYFASLIWLPFRRSCCPSAALRCLVLWAKSWAISAGLLGSLEIPRIVFSNGLADGLNGGCSIFGLAWMTACEFPDVARMDPSLCWQCRIGRRDTTHLQNSRTYGSRAIEREVGLDAAPCVRVAGRRSVLSPQKRARAPTAHQTAWPPPPALSVRRPAAEVPTPCRGSPAQARGVRKCLRRHRGDPSGQPPRSAMRRRAWPYHRHAATTAGPYGQAATPAP